MEDFRKYEVKKITFEEEYKNLEPKDKELLKSSLKKNGISIQQFQLLRDILYSNVQSYKTLLLAIEYCLARKLDIFKRSIQIVPIWDKSARKNVDTIWPSIAELRVTAHRTGEYAGHDRPEIIFDNDGLPIECTFTVYRMVKGEKCAFSSTIWYSEVVNKTSKDEINPMWTKRPIGQLTKCAEAAALRAAFPEEIGNDYIGEEAFLNASTVSTEKSLPKKEAAPLMMENKMNGNELFNMLEESAKNQVNLENQQEIVKIEDKVVENEQLNISKDN